MFNNYVLGLKLFILTPSFVVVVAAGSVVAAAAAVVDILPRQVAPLVRDI